VEENVYMVEGRRRLKDLTGVGEFVPGKGWYIRFPVADAPTPPPSNPPSIPWGTPTPWGYTMPPTTMPTPTPPAAPTPAPTLTGAWPDMYCLMIHGAGNNGAQIHVDITSSQMAAFTGLYTDYIRDQWCMDAVTDANGNALEDEGFYYWGEDTLYAHYTTHRLAKNAHFETCRNFIMIDTDARNRGYTNYDHHNEICDVITGSDYAKALGNVIITHSNGGPTTSRAFIRGVCARSRQGTDLPFSMSNPPMFSSQSANFAEWACSHANQILGRALMDIYGLISNLFLEVIVTLVALPLLFIGLVVWSFTNIGDAIIQGLQNGAYCDPQESSITIWNYAIGDYVLVNLTWNYHSPSHQTTVFKYLNVSNSPVSRYAFPRNWQHYDGTCSPSSQDPRGCDGGNFIIGPVGSIHMDFNRHDDDDDGSSGWGLWNDDDDLQSGYTYKWMQDDGVNGSFWRRSRAANSYNGEKWVSGENDSPVNYKMRAESDARLCGYSAMGCSVGMGVAMFGIGLLARMRVHWDHWCINWGPYSQFCAHRGCHNTLGMSCMDWVGAMDSNDGMVDMISCTYGFHKTGQPCQYPNGLGKTGMPHPQLGSRTVEFQPTNHEDGTGRNGDSWLLDHKHYSPARDPKTWIWQHAMYWTKEAKVEWCVDNGHLGAGLNLSGNSYMYGQCNALNFAVYWEPTASTQTGFEWL